jgi:DNA replication and repair protein RecF
VNAHLDTNRRAALHLELAALGAQAWMTGADDALFAQAGPDADIFDVTPGQVNRRVS